MNASVLEVIGAVIACGGTGAALVLVRPSHRYAAMGLGLAAAVALLAGEVWGEDRFEELVSTPAALGLGLILGGTALGATAATFQRVPAAFAIAAFAVLPLRLPIQIGGETNFLLIPLYGVIAGGFLRGAWLCAVRRGEELRTASAPRDDETPVVRWLSIALAVSLVVYAVGIAWSDNPGNAVRTVAFFLAPFASLLALLRDLRWHRKLVGQVLLASVLVTVGFALLGLWQYLTRDLLLNKDLKDANELHLYFRVNSLFRDPNVLGRYLALATIGVAAWIAWQRPRREAAIGLVAAAVMLAALTLTYSQTSFAALAVGLGLLAWFRFGLRGLALATALAAVAACFVLIAGGPPADEAVDKDRTDLAEASSGRTNLITGGTDLFQDAPLVGQGSGSFATAYRREVDKVRRPVSHTEPITVAAEQGLLGLVPYVAVVGLAGLLIFRPWPARSNVRAGVAAAFAALLVHTVGYAGFAIDPATWALLALAYAFRE
ncbi:MAG: O-antigen ligase family protein [Actinomycetota bacterium]|nr:O-antigen ligase family protein [Actinomycetota bacterium]